MTKKHRGRIQAQGDGLEKSESWSQDNPLTKEEGLSLLEQLWSSLTKKEKEVRRKPYKDAKRYIENIDGGIDAIKKKTFRNRKTRSVRIDIEVLAGSAFLLFVGILLCFLLFN
ncbi:MAG: hypothetical protein AAGJ82_03790 [Bacteroidota bacterium]